MARWYAPEVEHAFALGYAVQSDCADVGVTNWHAYLGEKHIGTFRSRERALDFVVEHSTYGVA